MLRTRAQYVCIDAKASSSVIVYGPVDVIADVKHNLKHDRLNFVDVSLGTTARMSVSGCEIMFMKASVVEEVLKKGFTLLSEMKDDFLTLSREVRF